MLGHFSGQKRYLWVLNDEAHWQYFSTMLNLVKQFASAEQGQDLIEYTLLLAFVALASAALFIGAGHSVKTIWSTTNSQLAAAATSAS